jgi:leucyl aminopeptidase
VLSDVLAFATESSPTRVIDIATLSADSGLGPELWAGLGTDPDLIRQRLTAGAASGEPGWYLPLWDGYADRLRSEIADLKNFDATNASGFGAVYAALYLRHFVGSVPWAHIDLGLTVMRSAATGSWSAGANGNGTRTLARYLLATTRTDALSGAAHQPRPDT